MCAGDSIYGHPLVHLSLLFGFGLMLALSVALVHMKDTEGTLACGRQGVVSRCIFHFVSRFQRSGSVHLDVDYLSLPSLPLWLLFSWVSPPFDTLAWLVLLSGCAFLFFLFIVVQGPWLKSLFPLFRCIYCMLIYGGSHFKLR